VGHRRIGGKRNIIDRDGPKIGDFFGSYYTGFWAYDFHRGGFFQLGGLGRH
jgi:hypothetical protein